MLCILSLFPAILHQSTVLQGNSFSVLFNGLLTDSELPSILTVPQVMVGCMGVVESNKVVGKTYVK